MIDVVKSQNLYFNQQFPSRAAVLQVSVGLLNMLKRIEPRMLLNNPFSRRNPVKSFRAIACHSVSGSHVVLEGRTHDTDILG